MRKVVVTIFLILLSIGSVTAGTNGNNAWYGTVNIGTGYINQKKGGEDLIPREEDDIRNTPLLLDLGLYGLATQGTLLGLNANLTADFNVIDDAPDLNAYHWLLAISGIHYFNSEIGSGFFVKGGLGVALLSYTNDGFFSGYRNVSDWGMGVTLGGGFAINLGETSVTINGNYSFRGIDHNGNGGLDKANYNTSVLGIGLGLLY